MCPCFYNVSHIFFAYVLSFLSFSVILKHRRTECRDEKFGRFNERLELNISPSICVDVHRYKSSLQMLKVSNGHLDIAVTSHVCSCDVTRIAEEKSIICEKRVYQKTLLQRIFNWKREQNDDLMRKFRVQIC